MNQRQTEIQKNQPDSEKFDTVITLLNHLLAIQLYKSGATMDEICKNLHIRKTTVVTMLRGVKRRRIPGAHD